MRSQIFRVLLCVCSLPVLGGCAGTCPFLNSATAGGVLGGTVNAIVTHPSKNNEDASCEFAREDGSGKRVLTIEVTTMAHWQKEFPSFLARCSSPPAALPAIGNEAVACASAEKDTAVFEQVIGRVRERAFVVRASTSLKTAVRAELREQARNIAEQIAGNLF